MSTTIEKYEWYDGTVELQIKTQGHNHDISITLKPDGACEVDQEGHGGWSCCSSHSSYFELLVEGAVAIRDFLNDYIIDPQNNCDHLKRQKYPTGSDYGDPGFSCADCGYGT